MADAQQDKRPVWKNPVVIGLTTLAGVGVVTYFVRRSSTEDQGNGESEAGQLPSATQPTEPADTPTTPTGPQAPPPSVPEDVEFGEIQFPPDKTAPQWNHLQRLAQLAEEFTGITGLYSHLLAKADNESKGVMTAINAEGDGPSAFKLFCRDFNYNGRFTSASNERFDGSLRAENPYMGIRDFEAVCAVAGEVSLLPEEDIAMPANNRLLVFKRDSGTV